jgi:two-component system CheB/CheR fusion protein
MTKRKSTQKKQNELDKQPSPSPKLSTSPKEFPVVGIGASAGGLAAFEAFFSGMPTDTDPGMAFILVQHLAPDHKSILTELIKRYTKMNVYEVKDGVKVMPNCTYIIPPNRDMAFINGTLQLLEPASPHGQRLPIDFFFRSLAQDQHERAICVILSGTGSDGTQGLREIKGEGGMAMVQNPESTEYDGMPHSALSTGLVDYELPPAEMASQIIAYASHAFGKLPKVAAIKEPKREDYLNKIFVLLRAQTGHDFSQYKPSTINRRIERRMAVQQIDSIREYLKYMQQTLSEVDSLFRDLLIGVTNFFRDPEAFDLLEEKIIPKLYKDKNAESIIRIWIPGCSTGEEAYTYAILLAEHQEKLKRNFRVQIFATDIDTSSIDIARAGLYHGSITANVSPERLAKYFTPAPDGKSYRIHKAIRDMLVFSEQNLIKDPPFSKLDLISCRNLLIYMGSELQKKIIPLFHYSLLPNGFLFLGTSESVGEFSNLFTVQDRKMKIYQRKDDPHARQRNSLTQFLPSQGASNITLSNNMEGNNKVTPKLPLRELTEQTLLQQVSPAAVLVNKHGDILYLHGRTGLFLEPAAGEAGINNIIKMAREGLRRDLTTTIHKASANHETVISSNLRVKTNGDYSLVNLTVSPTTSHNKKHPESPLFLVVLEIALPNVSGQLSEKIEMSKDSDGSEAAVIEALQQELRANQEYLQSTHEEMETSNEELKSSNEEMQSVNEELQSTNEELETSKEELQSVNEELSTVNAELQTKLIDLSRANNDMNNLLAGTGIATVFVDHGLQIVRFTPAATEIINLIQSDVGRPVGHIVSNLIDYETLLSDTQVVLNTLVSKEVEVQVLSGEWYIMRIQPYRTLDNVIEGAVLTFVNITQTKNIKLALEQSENRYRSLFNSMSEMFQIIELIYDKEGVAIDYYYRDVNPAFAQLVGKSRDQLIDKRAKSVFGIVEDHWLVAYSTVEKTGEPVSLENYGAEFDKYFRINAWKTEEGFVAISFENITEHKKNELE